MSKTINTKHKLQNTKYTIATQSRPRVKELLHMRVGVYKSIDSHLLAMPVLEPDIQRIHIHVLYIPRHI